MNKEKNFISAVVYVHNNEREIYDYLLKLINLLDENFEHSEIICVNDYSTDNSTLEIKKAGACAKSCAITILNMSYFHGLEVAMNAGDELAIGDYLLEIDYVLIDYPIDMIMDIYKRTLEGYDIVAASPEKKQKFPVRAFYWLFQKFTNDNGHTKMQTETFRILSRRAVNRVDAMNRVVLYRKALYENCGLKTMRIKYKAASDDKIVKNKDKKTRKYRGSLAVDSLIMFTDMGYIIAKFMTIMMLLISFSMVLYTIVVYVSSNPVAGWTTTIMFMAVAFCGLFAMLMVIVKYLQLILGLNFKRKKYSFESIEKLTK